MYRHSLIGVFLLSEGPESEDGSYLDALGTIDKLQLQLVYVSICFYFCFNSCVDDNIKQLLKNLQTG